MKPEWINKWEKQEGSAGVVKDCRYYRESDKMFYGSESSQALPARPSGRGWLQIR